jgi:hypothetical protein
MLRNIGQRMGIFFDDLAPAAIHEHTGGHPYFARQFASCIFRHEPRCRHLSLAMVEKHLPQFTREVVPLFREIVQSLKERFPQELELLDLIAAGGVCDLNDLPGCDEDGLNHLLGYGLIAEAGEGRVRVGSGMLASWLNRRKRI